MICIAILLFMNYLYQIIYILITGCLLSEKSFFKNF